MLFVCGADCKEYWKQGLNGCSSYLILQLQRLLQASQVPSSLYLDEVRW